MRILQVFEGRLLHPTGRDESEGSSLRGGAGGGSGGGGGV